MIRGLTSPSPRAQPIEALGVAADDPCVNEEWVGIDFTERLPRACHCRRAFQLKHAIRSSPLQHEIVLLNYAATGIAAVLRLRHRSPQKYRSSQSWEWISSVPGKRTCTSAQAQETDTTQPAARHAGERNPRHWQLAVFEAFPSRPRCKLVTRLAVGHGNA